MGTDEPKQYLTALQPMLRFNLADDGNGDLCIVKAESWGAAFYHVHGAYPADYQRIYHD